jgi:hypothetical protein
MAAAGKLANDANKETFVDALTEGVHTITR